MHRTNVYEYGPARWGWDCDACTASGAGYPHAATAQAVAGAHERNPDTGSDWD